jgi:Tfp pilus assembly protein PilF
MRNDREWFTKRMPVRALLIALATLALGACKHLPFDSSAAPNPEVRPAAFADQPPAPENEPVYAGPQNNGPNGEVLTGNNPADDVKLGKKHYREQNFGLAERHFRRAVEAAPQNAEAWMGLAASYDRLRRFDLADRAYNQTLAILGPTPEVLNNHGYSYLLRGDYKNARKALYAAKAKSPDSPYVQSNIALLHDTVKGR